MQVKLVLLIQGSIAIILLLTQNWIETRAEHQILDSARDRALVTADGVINGMNMLMVTGAISDPKNRTLYIKKMAASKGIKGLSIIRAKQVSDQFGPGLPEEQPSDAIEREVLNTGKIYNKQIIANGANRESSMLRVIVPFIVSRDFRGTDCLLCHHVKVGSVNGAANILIDLTNDQKKIRQVKLDLWAGQLVLQLLLYIIIWSLVRTFTRPIKVLQKTMTAMQSDGDLSRRVHLTGSHEITQIASTFNALVTNLQRTEKQRDNVMQALEERSSQLNALNQVAVTITSSLNLQNMLDVIMKHGITLTGAKASCIAFYDEETGRFKEWITHGLSAHFVKNMSFQPGGLADEAFTTANYILSNDRPETVHKLSNLVREEGLRCFVCLPLTSHDHRLGVIYFYCTDRDTFKPTDIELLATFASLVAQTIDNARLYAQMQEQARTDALTGLNNRRTFDALLADELARAQRFSRPVSLLMLDIDHFKHVNDTYGHQTGDAVLKGLSELLGWQARAVDRVCRYGGEEITIILPETDLEIAAKVAERLRAAVEAQPFDVNAEAPLHITVSIGVASFPVHADSVQTLVAAADAAMYAAKAGGRNRVVRYEPVSGQEIAHE